MDPPKKEIKIWERMSQKTPLAIIAGNDAHQNVRLFGNLIDPYEVSFRFVNTYVWASERSEASILEALRLGKSYIAFSMLAEPKGFLFNADSAQIGVSTPPHAKVQIKLFHNQKVALVQETNEISLAQPKSGLWRCEVWIYFQKKWKPWIYSNMILVPNS